MSWVAATAALKSWPCWLWSWNSYLRSCRIPHFSRQKFFCFSDYRIWLLNGQNEIMLVEDLENFPFWIVFWCFRDPSILLPLSSDGIEILKSKVLKFLWTHMVCRASVPHSTQSSLDILETPFHIPLNTFSDRRKILYLDPHIFHITVFQDRVIMWMCLIHPNTMLEDASKTLVYAPVPKEYCMSVQHPWRIHELKHVISLVTTCTVFVRYKKYLSNVPNR